MKLYANLTNSRGKREGIGDNEYIEAEFTCHNKKIATLKFAQKENDESPTLEIIRHTQQGAK